MAEMARRLRIISYQGASQLIDAALRHADENGWSIAAVVLDPAGHIVAAARMDGVPAAILDIALDKAYTATLGKPTSAFFERMHSSPGLTMGLSNRPRLCAWEGGVPAFAGKDLLGAIGVSGAAGEEDVACATAAITALGLATGPG